MPTFERSHQIQLRGTRLTLVWVLLGPAGATHLQVALKRDNAVPHGSWRDAGAFIGRHAYRCLTPEDALRDGECDILPDTDSCWFSARDHYGSHTWELAQKEGSDAPIYEALESVYHADFSPQAAL